MKKSRILMNRRSVHLAWHPLRGRRCSLGFTPVEPGTGRFFLAAIGPACLGLGSGRPLP